MVKLAAKGKTRIYIMNDNGDDINFSGRVFSGGFLGRGFTFLEILLVVFLAGLLASVAGGVYVGTYKRMMVKKGAMDFLLAARYARITAVERQSRCRLKLDSAEGKYVMLVDESDEFGVVEEAVVKDLYFKPRALEGDVGFEGISIRRRVEVPVYGEGDVITFFPDGSADESLIQIGDGKTHFTVKISAIAGRVKIFDGLAVEVSSDSVDLDEVEF